VYTGGGLWRIRQNYGRLNVGAKVVGATSSEACSSSVDEFVEFC